MRQRFIRYLLIPLLIVVVVAIVVLLFRHKARFGNVNIADNEKPVVYVQQGHGSPVICIAWSPDGKHALSGAGEGIVKLWDVATGKELRTLQAHAGGLVSAVSYLPDGKRFVTGGIDSTVRLWEANTLTEVKRLHAQAGICAISLSADGERLLATTTDSLAYVWNLSSGKEISRLALKPRRYIPNPFFFSFGGSLAGALSPDGKRALTKGLKDSTLVLWDIRTGVQIRQWPLSYGDPIHAAFSADGTWLFCGTAAYSPFDFLRVQGIWASDSSSQGSSKAGRGGIEIWNGVTGEKTCSLSGHEFGVTTVQPLGDGKRLLTSGLDSTLRMWDFQKGSLVREFPKSTSAIISMAVSPDQHYALTGGADGAITLWDVERGSIAREFSRRGYVPSKVAFSAAGDLIRIGLESALTEWDARTGRRTAVATLDTGKLVCFFSKDLMQALVVSEGKTEGNFVVRGWSRVNGLQARIPARVCGPLGSVVLSLESCDFSADGRKVATVTETSRFTLWDMSSGSAIRDFHIPSPRGDYDEGVGARLISLSADGKQALACNWGPNVQILDFATGRQRTLYRDSTRTVKWIPVLLTYSNFRYGIIEGIFPLAIEIWDLAQGTMVRTRRPESPVDAIALSANERVFAGGILRQCVWGTWYSCDIGLWETETGRKLQQFTGHVGNVGCSNFSPDGRYLVSGANDGTTRIWNVETGREIVQFISFQNGEWIAVTPEGYYVASVNGDAFLNVRTGSKVTGIEAYRSTFYKPAVVEAALRLGDSEKAISEVLGCKEQCKTIADLPSLEPPYLNVKYPENNDTLKTADTTLAFHIEDRHSPIKAVKVYVNGRPVAGNATRSIEDKPSGLQLEIPKDKNTLDLKVTLRLDEGDNLITITALGKSEAVDSLHLFVRVGNGLTAQMEMDTVWILAVGVNKYQDQKHLRNLNYCVNDAQGVVQAFKAQEGKTCRKVMSLCISDAGPKKPTYENIVDNIGYLRQAKTEDLAVLFLAGHGVNDSYGDFYFLPSDAEVAGPQEFKKSKAISGAMLQTAVEVPARRFVFVDACHSGDVGVDLVKLAREFKDNRVLIMTSSEGNKPSEEADSLKHGLFTYALIKGLQGDADITGSDGKVSAMELIAYVSDKVNALTQHRQNPVFWAPGGLSNFVVAVSANGPTRMASSLP